MTFDVRVTQTRREVLKRAVGLGAGLAGLALAGCGGDDEAVGMEGAQPAAGSPGAGTVEAAASGWRRLQPSGESPPGRRDHALAYDAAAQRLYLHGGRGGGQGMDDLWAYELAQARWRRLAPSGAGPKPRFGHNAAFDAGANRLVLFGGQSGNSFLNDVWAYDASANRWTKLEEAGPAPRYGAGGAFDPAAGVFYLTHGFTLQGRFDDTWALSLKGAGWADVSASQGRPLKRCLLRAVWEPERGSVLLFGGQSNSAPYHDDFWQYDAGSRSWTEVRSDPRPSARHFYAAAYDVVGRRMVLFGGQTADGPVGDVWAFATGGGGWTRLDLPGGPAARNGHDAVYAADRRSVLVFGGAGPSGELNDVWELGLT